MVRMETPDQIIAGRSIASFSEQQATYYDFSEEIAPT
jgi:hypothetical protein